MTAEEYKNTLIELTRMKTSYNNHYPKNLGYVAYDGTRSFDCWNLIKAILNGYDIHNNTVGYFQKNLSKTGDCDGAGLLKQCSHVSTDFIRLGNEVKYLYMPGHAGSYIGYMEVSGHAYNVIECTGSWTRNVLLSWVDSDGTRRRYKGGAKNGKWKQHGVMDKWLTYSKPSVNKVTVTASLPMLQKGSKGSAVKVWQLISGTAVDGDFGNNTRNATLAFQQKAGLAAEGIVGRDTWTAGLNSLQ